MEHYEEADVEFGDPDGSHGAPYVAAAGEDMQTAYRAGAYDLGFEVEQQNLELLRSASLGGGEVRSSQLTGTRALMLAVLEDAIRCYLGGRKLVATEAEAWIDSGWKRSPFAFVVVCETLGLDADAVRRTLKAMKAAHVSPRQALPRTRNNVRVPGRVCLRKSARERRAAKRQAARKVR